MIKAGYNLDKVLLTTLQGISGSGYPGNSAFDLIDNTLPLLGEEIKSELEPPKILGKVANGAIEEDYTARFSAHCNRVAVIHGHSACVSFSFKGDKPPAEEITAIWQSFSSDPQELQLPSAPSQPVIYRSEPDRPQPRCDRDSGNGMSVTCGRLRSCGVLDYKFNSISHNIIRGAAGGAILIAELLVARGYVQS